MHIFKGSLEIEEDGNEKKQEIKQSKFYNEVKIYVKRLQAMDI